MFHLGLKSAIILLFAAAGFIAPFLEISFGDRRPSDYPKMSNTIFVYTYHRF